MSWSLHFKSKGVFAGINSAVPRAAGIVLVAFSTTPEPDINKAMLGPFNA